MNLQQILNSVKNYWFILLFVSGMIVTWANYQNSINNHEKRLDILEAKIVLSETTANEIKIRLAEIQTTLKFIEAQLSK